MSEIAIRAARAEELDAVSAILDRAWAEFDPLGEGEPTWESYRRSVPDVWSRLADSELLVAEHNAVLAGTVTYYAPDPAAPTGEGWPAGWASFRLLAVDPVARGAGVGRTLTSHCIGRARSDGAPTLGLHTSEWMHRARTMYERMGFVRYPDNDLFPRPGFVVTAYRLELTMSAPGAPTG